MYIYLGAPNLWGPKHVHTLHLPLYGLEDINISHQHPRSLPPSSCYHRLPKPDPASLVLDLAEERGSGGTPMKEERSRWWGRGRGIGDAGGERGGGVGERGEGAAAPVRPANPGAAEGDW
uniref:Uncharacterized protein n=1 Tax=Oryza punctata TaxID=4537 RepID=A0A0E0LQ34_ORYPU